MDKTLMSTGNGLSQESDPFEEEKTPNVGNQYFRQSMWPLGQPILEIPILIGFCFGGVVIPLSFPNVP